MNKIELYKIEEEEKLSKLIEKKLKTGEKEVGKVISNYNGQSEKELLLLLSKTIKQNTESLLDILIKYIKKVIKQGFKTSKRNLGKDIPKGIVLDFYDTKSLSYKYLKKVKTLHLSDYQGSISKTTNKRVKNLLKEGLDKGYSYTKIGKSINELDKFVFGKKRSELIAITEIGRAYEIGNLTPIRQMENKGYKMEKKAITAGDAKVRPEHRQNGNDGWIDRKKVFSGTSTNLANTGFRCRCATQYRKKVIKK